MENQAEMLRQGVESGLDMIEEYGGPLLDRYGRTAIIVGVGLVAAVGVALIIARRRRRRPLISRVREAMPDAVTARIKQAADRISG
jgi:hypothetical protein